MRLIGCLVLVLLVCGCGARGAVKVNCEGRLSPINRVNGAGSTTPVIGAPAVANDDQVFEEQADER
jgi:hypothetical protein